ncbi:MAG: PASTA domain-containing protein [Candidatus Zixiibacteriota bacterium]|nr:MAG: PASTA domain-containing protein [candidate division Zixibacteria bacterium]
MSYRYTKSARKAKATGGRPLMKWVIFLPVACVSVLIVVLVLDNFIMPAITRHRKEEVVPTVVGLSREAAQRRVKDLGFDFAVTGQEYSPDKPMGKVLFQSPEPGTVSKAGRTIKVIVSRGRATTEVPEVRGLALRQAQLILQEKGLAQGMILSSWDDSLPEGVVIETQPPAGTLMDLKSEVSLVVNRKSDTGTILVLDFVGKDLERGLKLVETLGLTIRHITYRVEDRFLPETIISQSLIPGIEVDDGTEIDFVVSVTE